MPRFCQGVRLGQKAKVFGMFQEDLRALRRKGAEVRRHAALQQPEVADVAKATLGMVSKQSSHGISRRPAPPPLALALLVLRLQRALARLVDQFEELARFGCVL